MRSTRYLTRGRVAALPAACLVAFALLGGVRDAGAQDKKAAAESLFQAGRALLQKHDYVAACPKFAESQNLDPSVGTLLNLAECYEGLGRTASAWAEYKDAGRLARKVGDATRQKVAEDAAAKLEPKLSKLRIDATDVPGLSITRDGEPFGKGGLGTPIAVDPGEHVIEASAPGYETWTGKVVVGQNADSQTLQIPALTKAAASAVPAPGGPAAPAAGGAPAPGPDAGNDPSAGTKRTAGFVLGGVGVAGIGLGAVFGLMASSQKSSAESDPKLCPDKKCFPAGRAEIDAASTKALVSTIGFGVGAAALATGVVLILTSHPAKKEQARAPRGFATVAPSFGAGYGGAAVAGTF